MVSQLSLIKLRRSRKPRSKPTSVCKAGVKISTMRSVRLSIASSFSLMLPAASLKISAISFIASQSSASIGASFSLMVSHTLVKKSIKLLTAGIT